MPELKALRDSAHQQLADACVRLAGLLRGEDSETPSEGATRSGQRLHALADGLALHLMHQAGQKDLDRAAELLEDEIRGIAAGRA